MMSETQKEFTGKKFAFWFFLIFGLVLSVNIFMLVMSQRSWPGRDEVNPYERSQSFDVDRDAQQALGWQSEVFYDDGKIVLSLDDKEGRPVSPNAVNLRVGRPANDREDAFLTLRFDGEDFVADHPLGAGKWIAYVDAEASNGTNYRQTHLICLDENAQPQEPYLCEDF